MKQAFLIGAGVLFVFGMDSDALAHSKTRVPVEAQESHILNGFAGKVELISGPHHRRHQHDYFRGRQHGHFRSHRPGRNFGHGYSDHRHDLERRNFGGLHLYKFYRPYYYRPYGNYYSGGYSYRGPGYYGYKNYGRHYNGRHYRGYEYGPYIFPDPKY